MHGTSGWQQLERWCLPRFGSLFRMATHCFPRKYTALCQVLTEMEDLHHVPVYFVEGIEFADPPNKVVAEGE